MVFSNFSWFYYLSPIVGRDKYLTKLVSISSWTQYPFTLLITLKPFSSVEWRYKRKVLRKSFRFICQIFCHRLSVETNIAPNLSQSPSELNIPFTLLITLKPFSSVEWSCGKVSNLTKVIDNHYFACLL